MEDQGSLMHVGIEGRVKNTPIFRGLAGSVPQRFRAVLVTKGGPTQC